MLGQNSGQSSFSSQIAFAWMVHPFLCLCECWLVMAPSRSILRCRLTHQVMFPISWHLGQLTTNDLQCERTKGLPVSLRWD